MVVTSCTATGTKERTMVGCILTGHGTFAEGVGAALEMVGGPQEDFAVVTFLEDEAAEFQGRISALLDELGLSKPDLPIRLISSVIAVHTGPYPLGIGVLRRARLDK